MTIHAFAPQFLRDFRALESGMSESDSEALDALLATVVRDPEMRGRFSSFYDPAAPTWLVRKDPFVLHYAYDPERDRVVFLNLFRRR